MCAFRQFHIICLSTQRVVDTEMSTRSGNCADRLLKRSAVSLSLTRTVRSVLQHRGGVLVGYVFHGGLLPHLQSQGIDKGMPSVEIHQSAMSSVHASCHSIFIGISTPAAASYAHRSCVQNCRSWALIPVGADCHISPVHTYSRPPLLLCTGMTKFCWALVIDWPRRICVGRQTGKATGGQSREN